MHTARNWPKRARDPACRSIRSGMPKIMELLRTGNIDRSDAPEQPNRVSRDRRLRRQRGAVVGRRFSERSLPPGAIVWSASSMKPFRLDRRHGDDCGSPREGRRQAMISRSSRVPRQIGGSMSKTAEFDTDILIVGSGPTGATAALALATLWRPWRTWSRAWNWLADSPRAHITNQARQTKFFRDPRESAKRSQGLRSSVGT